MSLDKIPEKLKGTYVTAPKFGKDAKREKIGNRVNKEKVRPSDLLIPFIPASHEIN